MDIYGIIGYSLTHSFSAKFFAEKFKRENINAEYLNFEIKSILDIRKIIIFNQHLKGLNVTIPYKEKVIPFLNSLSAEAKKIAAVNVIKISRKSDDFYFYELTGYNSDYIGFKKSLIPFLQSSTHRYALILGTGGAAKAVAYALTDLDIEWLTVSRSPTKGSIGYCDLTADIIAKHTIIINTTPVGTFPNSDECPNIPYKSLTTDHLLYDLIYNPEETLFLKRGQEQGSKTKNGKEMLELQALEAWDIWSREA